MERTFSILKRGPGGQSWNLFHNDGGGTTRATRLSEGGQTFFIITKKKKISTDAGRAVLVDPKESRGESASQERSLIQVIASSFQRGKRVAGLPRHKNWWTWE